MTVTPMPNALPADRDSVARLPAHGLPSRRLPLRTVSLFAVPALGQGFMFLLSSLYLLKFSTDVLGIAPAAMGVIFLLSRVWDAVSDPLAGYLSDRTRTRWGRRRPWLIVGAIPIGLVFYAMWAPPTSLSAEGMQWWMGAAVIAFYTGMTVFNMPHNALAAELSDSYQERNRIFGIRRAFFGVGTLLVFGAIGWLSEATDPRSDARTFAAVGAIVTTISMLATGIFISERPDYSGRGSTNGLRAFGEVIRNPHARILIAVFFLQQIGIGAISFMGAYYAEYILGEPGAFAPIMGALFITSLISIPLWISLGHRFDKKRLLMVAMCVIGTALFSMGFLTEGHLVPVMILAATAGVAVGGLDVLFPSMQADVIDFDELQTDERKEGVYFAAWAFAEKAALGVSGMLAGFALSATGYVAGVEQPEEVELAIRGLMSGIPLVVYGIGIWVFRRFALTRELHAQMREQLDARAASRAVGGQP